MHFRDDEEMFPDVPAPNRPVALNRGLLWEVLRLLWKRPRATDG